MINHTVYPGQKSVDPFAPENIELATEQISDMRRTPTRTAKPKKLNEPLFVQYPYNAQLELAKHARNCLIAVQAELYRLYFQNWDKTQPIELGNSVFRSLGFDNKQKKRALKALEAAKHIKIQWRGNQSPLIVLTATGFRRLLA